MMTLAALLVDITSAGADCHYRNYTSARGALSMHRPEQAHHPKRFVLFTFGAGALKNVLNQLCMCNALSTIGGERTQ
jgi:hypothetical protein